VEFEFWGVMAGVYFVSYYIHGWLHLSVTSRETGDSRSITALAGTHKKIFKAACYCSIRSMGALTGIQVVADQLDDK
jgi:hypothetical protein